MLPLQKEAVWRIPFSPGCMIHRDVVNGMAFAGVCLHKIAFMFDESEPRQIRYVLRQIIISSCAPLM